MKTMTALLIGAGDRGARAYAPYALDYPHELKIVAVAEPNMERRGRIQKEHQLPNENCYESWEEISQRTNRLLILPLSAPWIEITSK